MNNDLSISDLLNSINDSIEDIRKNPTISEIPSNLNILLTGVNGEKGLDFLFSSGLDKILEKLFDLIQTGNFEKILENEEQITEICEALFGKGSFQGPVSRRVLGSIQSSMSSNKYQRMRSFLGKTVTKLKKIRLVMKNLEKEKKNIHNAAELAEYNKALYAIKQVLKIAEVVYRKRKIINRELLSGLNAIVHS